jgi:hypothetical protein
MKPHIFFLMVVMFTSAGAQEARTPIRLSAAEGKPHVKEVATGVALELRGSRHVLVRQPGERDARIEVILDGVALKNANQSAGAVTMIVIADCPDYSVYLGHQTGLCGSTLGSDPICVREFARSIEQQIIQVRVLLSTTLACRPKQ